MSGFHHCLLKKRSGMLLARATDACTELLSLISAPSAELQAATHSPLSFFWGVTLTNPRNSGLLLLLCQDAVFCKSFFSGVFRPGLSRRRRQRPIDLPPAAYVVGSRPRRRQA